MGGGIHILEYCGRSIPNVIRGEYPLPPPSKGFHLNIAKNKNQTV